MAKQKRKHRNPYQLNIQLGNAFNWLRSMKYLHNAADLASKWKKSQATVSCYLKMRRALGAANAASFEKQFLKRHELTLEDFATPILVKQVEQATNREVNTIITTKLLVLESAQELMLEKLEQISEELRELRDLVTKK